MKNASSQKEDQLHLSVYSALEGLGISVHKSKKARGKRRSLAKADITRGRLCSASCEKEDYPFIASPKQKLFGIVLSSAEWDMDCKGIYAPKFLIMATEYLLLHQKSEGLFRKPGASNRLKALKILLEDGGNLTSVGISHVYDVACILKQWLRELPEPLIPYAFHEMFLTCYDIQHEEDRLKALCLACLLLPSEHLQTLMYILKFLFVIAEQDANKMDAHNLALVMSPCLMPLPKLSVDGETTKLLLESRTQIIRLLIKHASVVGKTDWLEETLTNGYNTHSELAQRKAKTKSSSKSVHGIFHNLRKKISHVQSPSPQQRSSSSKVEKPPFYSQRHERQKSKKALHSPCTLNELGDVLNMPKTGSTPLKTSIESPLKPSKLSIGSSGNETANSSFEGNAILSPLLNITNSSFTKESPFSRPNKFRLENERACHQLNSNMLGEEPRSPAKDSEDEHVNLKSAALVSCDMTTPVCPSRQCSRRSQSLRCESSAERGLGISKNAYKPSSLLNKSHLKAKYRRDSWYNIKNVSSLLRSASSPASHLEILKATTQLEKQAAIILKESYRNTLMSDFLSCTETKSSLRRGRPNTRSSGLPSPTWTRSVPCDDAEVTLVETTPTVEATAVKEDKSLTSPSPIHESESPRPDIPLKEGEKDRKNKVGGVKDSPHALGSSSEVETLSFAKGTKNKEPLVTENRKTSLTSLKNVKPGSTEDANVQTEKSELSPVTPINDEKTKLKQDLDFMNIIKEPKFDQDYLSVPWTDARTYFRMPDRPRAAKSHSTVRESILMLRTNHAGKVQQNVQLFNNMSSAFSVPAVRRAPSCKQKSRHSFSLKVVESRTSLRNKPVDGKSPVGGSKVYPSDKCALTRNVDSFLLNNVRNAPIPRALFNRSLDLVDKDTFSSTENLISPQTDT